MQKKSALLIALIVIVVTPFAISWFRSERAAAAERQKLMQVILTNSGKPALDAADSMVRISGGEGALRSLLGDADAPAEARLIAGLEMAEYRVATPSDLAEVEKLIQRPSPLRARFVEIYSKQESVDWSDDIERWMITVLEDPEPAMRLDAVRVLIGHSVDGPSAPQAYPALQRLAHDVDPAIRAEAMLRTSACPRDRIAELLMDGTRDPDPAVRLAVLKRLGWRFGGLEDTPADIALRRELANTLLRDTDPAVHAAAVQFTRQ